MPGKAFRETRYWWITASDKDPSHGWNWRQFFEAPYDPKQCLDFGGPDWIRSPVSRARVREMCKGDIVVAYQAAEGIVGFVYLASDGYPQAPGGMHDSFDLRSKPTVWLKEPVPFQIVRELPDAREDIEFVRARVKQGTVFRITERGFDGIVKMARSFNPSQAGEIRRFLSQSPRPAEAETLSVDD